MQCPKCGHEQANTIECESCGIIFAKYRQRQETQPELPAIRTPRKPKRQPPYVMIGAVAAVLLILSILIFVGGDEKNEVPTTAVKDPVKTTVAQDNQAANEARYRYYKELTGYNLDRVLLRFQPAIINEYLDEFNYHWIRAYSCEYSAEIKKDKSRFYEVMGKVMDDELRYRYDYPVKFQHSGDLSVKLVSEVRNEVKVRPYIRVRMNLTGRRAKEGPGCSETRNMNTRHSISFAPLRRDLTIEVPRSILERLDFPERGFELESDIKFRIDSTQYEYLRSQQAFRVKHKAVIEEMSILNNDNAPREERIFMTLRESQLY